MLLGIDFDNTIVRYDHAFHGAAVDEGLIPADLAATKTAVRDHLRSVGREDDWTRLQGHVYGLRMDLAEPFPGLADFFRNARAKGVDLCIVSHKTRTPYAGPPHDLHKAALAWMEGQGFFADDGLGLDREAVFLEPTKEAKLARIGALGCAAFVDDLPEFLSEPAFPAATRPVLFDPNDAHPDAPMGRVASWAEAASLLLAEAA